jgi:hypothetical protein
MPPLEYHPGKRHWGIAELSLLFAGVKHHCALLYRSLLAGCELSPHPCIRQFVRFSL